MSEYMWYHWESFSTEKDQYSAQYLGRTADQRVPVKLGVGYSVEILARDDQF